MALFVEVDSTEKNCPVIINLDHIVEIAPLVDGGCVLFMMDGAGVNSRHGLKVKNGYDSFKQFAMQTVTAEDIARRFPKVSKDEAPAKETKNKSNIKSQEESKCGVEIDIPVFGKN